MKRLPRLDYGNVGVYQGLPVVYNTKYGSSGAIPATLMIS
jgi:hypothetical protein